MNPPIAALVLSAVFTAAAQAADPAQTLAEAVRFKTISYQDAERVDYDQFRQLEAFLRERFPLSFGRLQVETVNEHSLLLVWPGSDADADGILFTAHTDVVPIEPGTEGDWDHPPFGGVIENGRIYGRGTLDDKAGVLTLLEATERLLASGFEPRRTIVLAFGHDEEIGGEQGAAKLAERMRELGLRFAWMVDEGGFMLDDHPLLPGRTVASVSVAEKGYLTLILSIEGEGGHSSMPPRRSTIGRLATAVATVEASPFPTRLVAPVEAMLSELGNQMGFPMSAVLGNLWLTEPLVLAQMEDDRTLNAFIRTTTALTMFNAGVKENVVPQRAEARINFRLLPGDEPEDVVEHVRLAINDPNIDIRFERWQKRPPVSDHTAVGFDVIRRASDAVYPGVVVTPSLLMATTDTRHYFELADDVYRYHGFVLGLDQASSVHGTNEYLGVESYLGGIAVAEQMLKLGSQ